MSCARILFVVAVLCGAAVCPAATPRPGTSLFESTVAPKAEGQLDQLVFQSLARMNLQPALCSDGVFVRRAYLDVIGTLPTAKEAREFIEDPDGGNKRKRLINQLLERPEFADFWAMKWSDLLRIKAEFPVNLWPNAAQAYHRWVRVSLAENKPYDQFVRELLTSSGSNFRVGPVNFYRAVQNRTPEGIAGAVALTFMGTRIEAWPTNRVAGMAGFFSQIGFKPTGQWKEEHVFWDPVGLSKQAGNTAPGRASVAAIGQASNTLAQGSVAVLAKAAPVEAILPDGVKVQLSFERDPREVFADWLINPKNPWFTRSIVNRVWAWLLGRGLIDEPDDIRDDNPPSHPALLAYLEEQMISGHYDIKSLFRLILTSQTYQLASTSQNAKPPAQGGFGLYALRRLDAEVLVDAVNRITGSSDLYTSPIPEPFTYIPKGRPAISIADGSISSPVLALFGRSARATGLEHERDNKPTPAQWLYLLNSSEIQRKLEQGTNLQVIVGFGRKTTTQIAEELYLTILSRFPTSEEIKAVEAYSAPLAPKLAPGARPGSTNSAATNLASAQLSGTNVAPGSGVVSNPAANSNSNRPPRVGPLGSLGTATKTTTPKFTSLKQREDWVDIAWALINSDEFWYRH